MDISRWAQLLAMRWGEERDAGCPEALTMGISYGPRMVQSAIEHLGSDPTFTPATHVCDDMLSQGTLFDYRFSIQMRRFEPGADLEQANLDGVEEETQGYVDAIGLYCGVSAWAQERAVKRRFGDIPGEPSEPSQWLVNWPAFGELTDEAQSMAAGFVRNNETWAKATFQDSDLLDGKVFMTQLVSRVEDSPTTAAYRRGVRTARDTLVAYANVLISVLGQLSE
jgi:hypothetical protein